jgi:hypothetical protein
LCQYKLTPFCILGFTRNAVLDKIKDTILICLINR